jgi:hypothetical protein
MELLLLWVSVSAVLFAAGICTAVWLGNRKRAIARAERLQQLAFADETPGMFASSGERGAGRRRAVAVAAVAIVMMSIAGGVFALHDTTASHDPAAPQSADRAPRTIDLLALRHTIDGHRDFVVTGEVRNPPDGESLVGAAAHVALFDRQGRPVAAQHAPLSVAVLHAGEAAPFKVVLSPASGVVRYRVQFRRSDGSLVPHIDRRTAGASDPVKRHTT